MANPSAHKIRVLVVDDSAFMCKVLRKIINSDPRLEVVGEAHDGRDAVALAASLRPDVISMDINMPHVDGVQATELIMSQHPRPIVIVSSESHEGDLTAARALEMGAIDFVSKPSGAIDLDMQAIRDELTRKLNLAAKVRVIRNATRPGARTSIGSRPHDAQVASLPPRLRNNPQFPIVVIVASTGGPAAITRVVSELPPDLSAAVLLVLHMPVAFTTQFEAQLADASPLPVKTARSSESLTPATIYLCPGSHHLRISSTGQVVLDTESPDHYRYRPSADLTLETVAHYAGPFAMGVVLTGMGNDGAAGAGILKASGGYVVAQDEATSTIFGMPAEAIKAGAVDEVLPLGEISAAISRHVGQLLKLAPAVTR
jgi:two-component system chemotaxis response regulator CheB